MCSIFERGLNFVGGDYAGYGLWSKYITFTARQESTRSAAEIYRRALGQPLKDLDKCFNRCNTSIDSASSLAVQYLFLSQTHKRNKS